MRRRKQKPKVYATASEYIDPVNCDSVISFKVVRGRRHLYGDVSLTDCNRKIDWSFDNDKGSILKIERAIAILQRFRIEFEAAQKKERARR